MQTRCIRIPLHDGATPQARAWMRSFADRDDEARAAMRRNGLALEAVFLEETPAGDFLLMVQSSEDFAVTSRQFLGSELAIDIEAREMLPELGERGAELELLVQLYEPPR